MKATLSEIRFFFKLTIILVEKHYQPTMAKRYGKGRATCSGAGTTVFKLIVKWLHEFVGKHPQNCAAKKLCGFAGKTDVYLHIHASIYQSI